MSTVTSDLNNGQQSITNYDLSKIFVFNNRYDQTRKVVNSEYDPMSIPAGTVMGVIAGANTLWPCISTATDGSQDPVGILAADITIADGTSSIVPLCISGDIVQDKIKLWNTPTDTLSTVVSSKTFYDRINALGIKIVANNEQTYLDNQ